MQKQYALRWLALVAAFFFTTLTTQAQSPSAIPYQAVARNGSGNLLQNQAVSVQFSIREGSVGGTVLYQETHSVSTNNLGLFSVNIGQGAPTSGTFAGINWGSGSKFAQVELDPAGGSSYVDMGTTQMLSVPYALYAAQSGSAANETDPQVGSATTNAVPKWNGTTLTDGLIHDDGTNVGIGTTSPSQKLDIVGTTKTTGFQMPTGAASGHVLQSDGSGNASWVAPTTLTSATPSKIQDADADTKIETEQNADEDAIRISIGGTEYYKINAGKIEVNNTGASIYIGASVGAADNFSENDGNVGVGANALQNVTSNNIGDDGNTALGRRALQRLTTGRSNSAVGFDALRNATGEQNTALGHSAGTGTANYSGSKNTFLGYSAGRSAAGSDNTFIGYGAGINNTGSGNVFIGKSAGGTETGDNKLYIDNSSTSSPLIWGDFSSNYLNFNANVGIGTTSPSQKLDVVGTTKTVGFQMPTGAANGYVLQSDGSGNASWVAPTSLTVDGDDLGNHTATQNLQTNGHWLSNDGGDEGLFVQPNGNVGIGTSSPQAKLAVNGDVVVDQSGTNTGNLNNGALRFGSGESGEAIASCRTNDGNQFGLDFYTNDLIRMSIDLDGNIGIGHSNPTELLDVDGKTKTTNFQMTDGAASGRILQSDGAGNASWADPGSLSITEADPEVSSTTTSRVPRWTGSTLSDGTMFDDGTNIGIGTTSPQAYLDITGTQSGTNSLLLRSGNAQSSTSSNQITFGFNGTTNYRHAIKSRHNSGAQTGNALDFYLWNYGADATTASGTQHAMTLYGNGNVGIGTTSPDVRLHAVTTDADEPTIIKAESSSANGAWLTLSNSSTGGTNWNFISTGSASSSGAGDFWLRDHSNIRMTVESSTGNVGIGTTSPSQKLDVSGTTKTTNFQMTNGATNGYVLQSDASGNASWVTPSAAFTDTDNQTLGLSGTTLSIASGNSVDISQKQIKDTDGDTKIQVEESTDEDKIRFDLGGNERWVMQGGRLEPKNTGNSTYVGENAGSTDDFSSNNNTGMGYNALTSSSTGAGNVAIGSLALQNNTGNSNVGIGYQALNSNTTGTWNLGIGQNALRSCQTLNYNIAVGGQALAVHTSGIENIAIGQDALLEHTSGSNNTVLGHKAGEHNLTGSGNVFLGHNAGNNETGDNKLYIDNSSTSSPLIWGDFSSDYVNINGNLGIGTTSPQAKLAVNGAAVIDQSGTNTGNLANGSLRFGGGSSGEAIASCRTSAGNQFGLDFYTNDIIQMSINDEGNVGIGTITPTQARLVVEGFESANIGGYGFLNDNGNTGTSSGTHSYSIYASNRVAASEFNAHSDARIKHVYGRSDNAADLETLMQLKITDYTLIDTVAKGNKPYKKVIAQEVEQVYPQAVSTMAAVAVPDIYQATQIENGFVSLENAGLKTGERVKLIFGEKQEIAEVTAVTGKGFQTSLKGESGQVFVYGREVSDFRTVDYEALSMLNVSATQELVKQLSVLRQQNAALQTRVSELEQLAKRIDTIEAMLKGQPK